jgi:hypothetical protein
MLDGSDRVRHFTKLLPQPLCVSAVGGKRKQRWARPREVKLPLRDALGVAPYL